MNSNDIIKNIVDNLDIVETISKYISVIKRGQNFFAICPFHDDTRPSLVISRNKKIFKCFVCNTMGNVISFVAKYKKISNKQAIYELAQMLGVDKNQLEHFNINSEKNKEYNEFIEINKQACEIFKNFLHQKENHKILDYLYKRGLSDEFIKKFKLGYAPPNNMLLTIMTNKDNFFGENRDKNLIWELPKLLDASLISLNDKNGYIDFFINKIIFPIEDEQGNVVGFSGRAIDKKDNIKYLNSKSSKFFQKNNIFYNFKNAINSNKEKLYLTEGYMDVISPNKYNYENIIGTMGTAFNTNHINLLKKYSIDTIILAMDNDNAGINANLSIGNEMLKNGFNVYVLNNELMNECKDLDECVQKLDKDSFDKLMNSYITYIEFLIKNKISNDSQLDEKLKNINLIQELIVKYGDHNLISYYSELISKRSGLNFDDIKQKIESKIAFNWKINNLNFKNNNLNSQRKEHSTNRFQNMKIFINEKRLVFNMIFERKVIDIFENYLNYLNISRVEKEYNVIKQILINFNKFKNNFSESEIFDEIKNNTSNTFFEKFKKSYDDILRRSVLINNLTSNDIILQSINIIIELLKYAKSKYTSSSLSVNTTILDEYDNKIKLLNELKKEYEK